MRFATRYTRPFDVHLGALRFDQPHVGHTEFGCLLQNEIETIAFDHRLRQMQPQQRRAFATALGGNLVLNTGWSWLFFTARRPRWALAEILLMEASTLDLTRRAAKADSPAGTMLLPYAGWVAFATCLNAAIVRRNPQARR